MTKIAENRVTLGGVNEEIVRNIVIFSRMVHPGEGDSVEIKQFSHQIKALLSMFSIFAANFHIKSPDVELEEIDEMVGVLAGMYLARIGGMGILSTALFSGQQQDFTEEVKSQTRKGIVAGLVFQKALLSKSSLYKAASYYADEYAGGKGPIGKLRNSKNTCIFKINPETFVATIWQQFKGVAHMWAALNYYLSCQIDFTKIPFVKFEQLTSPYSDLDLPKGYFGFSVLAEAYRLAGCTFRPPRSTTTILDPNLCK